MTQRTYRFQVQVYYEDTDHSGVVYHANYLKYFERAREGVISPEALVALWKQKGLGFAVYKANVSFLDGAEFGDTLDIVSTVRKDSDYRKPNPGMLLQAADEFNLALTSSWMIGAPGASASRSSKTARSTS